MSTQKKILTLGSGFVADHLEYDQIKDRIPCNGAVISAILDRYKPDVLVNCIGKTGRPNIDWCEAHPEETIETNTTLPLILADVCKKKGIHLIQIGSGCIFFGDPPRESGWKETDFANPKSLYSKSKYAADLALGEMNHVSVLRIRMPISAKNTERNLINKLKNYSQVIDIANSVTFMDELAFGIEWFAQQGHTGIYHFTNPGTLSAKEIMNEYCRYVPKHQFCVIDEQKLDQLTSTKRSNCILNTDKLTQKGFSLSDAKEALKICMKSYVKNCGQEVSLIEL